LSKALKVFPSASIRARFDSRMPLLVSPSQYFGPQQGSPFAVESWARPLSRLVGGPSFNTVRLHIHCNGRTPTFSTQMCLPRTVGFSWDTRQTQKYTVTITPPSPPLASERYFGTSVLPTNMQCMVCPSTASTIYQVAWWQRVQGSWSRRGCSGKPAKVSRVSTDPWIDQCCSPGV
jgi:hypothetical protein